MFKIRQTMRRAPRHGKVSSENYTAYPSTCVCMLVYVSSLVLDCACLRLCSLLSVSRAVWFGCRQEARRRGRGFQFEDWGRGRAAALGVRRLHRRRGDVHVGTGVDAGKGQGNRRKCARPIISFFGTNGAREKVLFVGKVR